MIVPFDCKVAFHHPININTVLRVSGVGAGAYDALGVSTSDNLVSATVTTGTTGWWTVTIPVSLSEDETYMVSLYPPAATNAKGVPLSVGEIGPSNEDAAQQYAPSGDGDVVVNASVGHNLGADGLRSTNPDGTGLDNTTINVYLVSDYDAGTPILLGTTVTGVDGRPVGPLMLNEGVYYFVFVPGDRNRRSVKISGEVIAP